ncbi:TPA: hypothetical protein ACKP2K_000701 [Serratia marcescens]
MGKRIDSTKFVYHWIKAEPHYKDQMVDYESAFNVLIDVIRSGLLKHGDLFKTGGEPCICFTESPEYFMHKDRSKYQPFGFKYYKDFIFRRGGRTVIYSPEEERTLLHEDLAWRYMLHDPITTSKERPFGVDFTWEREWRLPYPELSIMDARSIIVPNQSFVDRIFEITDDWLNDSANYVYAMTDGYYDTPDPKDEEYIDDIRNLLTTPDKLE